MNIGKAIKLCRIQKGMRQSDLASSANISTSYLSLIEKGKRDPNFVVLKAIAKGLDVPLSIIVFLATDQNEIQSMDPDLVEKLSITALELVRAAADEDVEI